MDITMDENTMTAIGMIVGFPCAAFAAWAFCKYFLSTIV